MRQPPWPGRTLAQIYADAPVPRTGGPSGYGYTNDGEYPFFPGVPCLHCGRFVGRDGIFNVEFFEMSNTLASMDAEHHACAEAASRRYALD